jgi:hypothetical protein
LISEALIGYEILFSPGKAEAALTLGVNAAVSVEKLY